MRSIACPSRVSFRPCLLRAAALVLALAGGGTATAQMSYEEGMARQRAEHHAQMMEHGRQLQEASAGAGQGAPAGADPDAWVPVDSPELAALYLALAEPTSAERTPAPPANSKVVHQSPDAVWLLFKASRKPGQGCAAVYARGTDQLVLAGANGAMPGSIGFIGKRIPATSRARETRITLSADGKPVDIRAIHGPGDGGAGLLLAPAVIEDTLPSIGDSETLVVRLDGKAVYEIRTEGAFKARDALRAGLAGRD